MDLSEYREAVRAQLARDVSEEVARDEREVDLYVRFQIDQAISSYEASINNAEERAESGMTPHHEADWRAFGCKQIACIRELLEIRRQLEATTGRMSASVAAVHHA
jgi:hypothetical protein